MHQGCHGASNFGAKTSEQQVRVPSLTEGGAAFRQTGKRKALLLFFLSFLKLLGLCLWILPEGKGKNDLGIWRNQLSLF